MIVMVPMAGRGLRFANQGYEFPKWMIRVFDKTILELSLTSVPLDLVDSYVFIVNREQVKNYDVHRLLSSFVKKPFKVIGVGDTMGQASSVALAADSISQDVPVCIINCDNVIHFERRRYGEVLPPTSTYCRVLVPVIDAKNLPPDFLGQKSYVEQNDVGLVVCTAEKERISDYVIAGMFVFNHFSDYTDAYAKMVSDGRTVNGEYYIAPLLNYCSSVWTVPVTSFHDLGTPTAVEQFIMQRQFMSKEFGFMDRLGIDYTRMTP